MRTNVVFLSSPDAPRSYYGSTVLRGRQLVDLLSPRLSDRYCLTFSVDREQAASVVILTKGFLAEASPQALADLKAARNTLLADPVDLGMSLADLRLLAAPVDGFVASSRRQMAALQMHFPDKPCHLVTHNVDRRLPAFVPPGDRLRIAYVGLRINCRYSEGLSRLGEIVETPTSESDDAWLGRLPEFNCHYALRRAEAMLELHPFLASSSGRELLNDAGGFFKFKPFTKGFTAAHCSVPILTERTESDAQFYLPEDYPFFLPSGAWNEVSDAIMRVREAFGGKAWQYALDVMRELRDRSSSAHIADEFEKMLAYYR